MPESSDRAGRKSTGGGRYQSIGPPALAVTLPAWAGVADMGSLLRGVAACSSFLLFVSIASSESSAEHLSTSVCACLDASCHGCIRTPTRGASSDFSKSSLRIHTMPHDAISQGHLSALARNAESPYSLPDLSCSPLQPMQTPLRCDGLLPIASQG